MPKCLNPDPVCDIEVPGGGFCYLHIPTIETRTSFQVPDWGWPDKSVEKFDIPEDPPEPDSGRLPGDFGNFGSGGKTGGGSRGGFGGGGGFGAGGGGPI